jgi:hypothetical protein
MNFRTVKDYIKNNEIDKIKPQSLILEFIHSKNNLFKEKMLENLAFYFLNTEYKNFLLNPIEDVSNKEYIKHKLSNDILIEIVKHKNTNLKTFHYLAENGDGEIQDTFEFTFQTQTNQLIKLLKNNNDLNIKILLALAKNTNLEIQKEVFKHPNSNNEIRNEILNKNINKKELVKELVKEIITNQKKYSSLSLANDLLPKIEKTIKEIYQEIENKKTSLYVYKDPVAEELERRKQN